MPLQRLQQNLGPLALFCLGAVTELCFLVGNVITLGGWLSPRKAGARDSRA